MFQLVPLKLWVSIVAYLALSGGPASKWILGQLSAISPTVASVVGPLITSQTIVLTIWAMIALVLCKPVWRFFWRLPLVGATLSKAIFPDLNGSWRVEIRSNWPIIDAMRNAAKGTRAKFDVISETTKLPELQIVEFRANIDQRWFATKVTLESGSQSVLKMSETLSVELLPAGKNEPKAVALTFKQMSNQPREPTDTQSFLGSALLYVKDGGRTLDGLYWTSRSWDRGLNSAGIIVMRKI